jgi:hypothetical protein
MNTSRSNAITERLRSADTSQYPSIDGCVERALGGASIGLSLLMLCFSLRWSIAEDVVLVHIKAWLVLRL